MAQRVSGDTPWWEEPFLEGLREHGNVCAAARVAGITTGGPYTRRKRCGSFRTAWEEALTLFTQGRRKPTFESTARRKQDQWQAAFLNALVETSNITASAKEAGVKPREVYRTRRADARFAAEWRAALFEGYANLEMEVLGYLRDPAPERKLDVAVALRLLSAHKETVAKERAQRANVSAAQVREAIERKVDELREKVAGREISPE
ncbi:hypothetical protein [Qipengyuania sp.]|uniref:hypothetical protein n=1 Tax=Qipengyuania sp. TaxID=2004515 RepID=UPI003AF65EA5